MTKVEWGSKFPMSPLIRVSASFPLTNPAWPAEPHELGYLTLKICICVWSHLLWSNREELVLCWRSAPNIPVWRHYSETNPAWMQHNYCCQGYTNTFTVDLPANDCLLLNVFFVSGNTEKTGDIIYQFTIRFRQFLLMCIRNHDGQRGPPSCAEWHLSRLKSFISRDDATWQVMKNMSETRPIIPFTCVWQQGHW